MNQNDVIPVGELFFAIRNTTIRKKLNYFIAKRLLYSLKKNKMLVTP
jgi:hypothetical protein